MPTHPNSSHEYAAILLLSVTSSKSTWWDDADDDYNDDDDDDDDYDDDDDDDCSVVGKLEVGIKQGGDVSSLREVLMHQRIVMLMIIVIMTLTYPPII